MLAAASVLANAGLDEVGAVAAGAACALPRKAGCTAQASASPAGRRDAVCRALGIERAGLRIHGVRALSSRGRVLRTRASRRIHTLGPVTPRSFDTFFAASAGVAGALIGLLFVAISVAQERLTSENADQAHRVRASAALTSFSNALAVALFGLVPGIGLGGPAFVVGLLGLLFVAGSLLSLRRVRKSHAVPPRDVWFLAGLVAVFVLQLYYALRLISRAGDVGAARGVAVLVVVCFFIGIARSWELVGGPSIGFGHELIAIVRARRQDREAQVPTSVTSEENVDER